MSAVNDIMHRAMEDEQFVEQFSEDPDAALAEYDLSSEQREELKEKVSETIGDRTEDRSANTVFTVAIT